jgi:hypothetical protein
VIVAPALPHVQLLSMVLLKSPGPSNSVSWLVRPATKPTRGWRHLEIDFTNYEWIGKFYNNLGFRVLGHHESRSFWLLEGRRCCGHTCLVGRRVKGMPFAVFFDRVTRVIPLIWRRQGLTKTVVIEPRFNCSRTDSAFQVGRRAAIVRVLFLQHREDEAGP